MTVPPALQAQFERNLAWQKSWPRCFFALSASVQVVLGIVIFVTEVFNVVMEFWYMNVFGGVWGSIVLLINWITIYSTVCCSPSVRRSTCSLVWNIITLITMGVLIAFDIVFILNPSTCLLTPSCATQSEIISLNFIMTSISQFKYYTTFDSKKLFLEIQVGCAGLAFVLSLIYIVVYIVCKVKLKNRTSDDFNGVSAPRDDRLPQQLQQQQLRRPPQQAAYAINAGGRQVPYTPY